MRIRTRQPDSCQTVIAATARAAAFSLVEILVVIAIIGILLAIVFKGGSALVDSAKKRDTEALLKKLDLAIDEYRREVDTSRIPKAKDLFNGCPPDNLLAFVGREAPIGGCRVRMRNSGEIRRNGSALTDTKPRDEVPYGDIRALVLAIRLNSPKAKAILDSIDSKYWAEPDSSETFEFQATTDDATIRLDYLVDSWGVPLEYYSTCIACYYEPLTPREWVSYRFVHENNDGAIVVSYGPNGRDQFDQDMIAAEGDSSMVVDYYEEMKDDPERKKGVLNLRLNADNLYSSDYFTNRIRQAGP